MLLRSGCCVMALDGSTVVGACLNGPLTRDEVMLNSVPPSVGAGMNWHSNSFKYQYVFQHILLGVSDKERANQSLLRQEIQSYCGHLRRTTLTLTVASVCEIRWLNVNEQ